MDNLNPAERSELMSRVRSQDTEPEMVVRRLVHGMGFRYRLHVKNLPGKPDLVFPSRGKIIFVHGCFWHGHWCRAGLNRPSSNHPYSVDQNSARLSGLFDVQLAIGHREEQ
jgi:DNA mismatch endonuclease (patch repair protein)